MRRYGRARTGCAKTHHEHINVSIPMLDLASLNRLKLTAHDTTFPNLVFILWANLISFTPHTQPPFGRWEHML